MNVHNYFFSYRYFKDSDGNDKEDIYHWWHTELADFFEHVTQLERKIEVFILSGKLFSTTHFIGYLEE